MITITINEDAYKVLSETEHEEGKPPIDEFYFVDYGQDIYIGIFDSDGVGRWNQADGNLTQAVRTQLDAEFEKAITVILENVTWCRGCYKDLTREDLLEIAECSGKDFVIDYANNKTRPDELLYCTREGCAF